MKTKEIFDPKIQSMEKINPKSKLRSLRPMRSMVAVRSLKPKTIATMIVNTEEMTGKN